MQYFKSPKVINCLQVELFHIKGTHTVYEKDNTTNQRVTTLRKNNSVCETM